MRRGTGWPVAILLSAGLLSGCATAIKYAYDPVQYRAAPAPYHVAVAIEDARPENERAGVFSEGTGDIVYTKDKDFKPNIASQVVTVFANHLRAARVFQAVSVGSVPAALTPEDATFKALADQGVDLLVMARLTHFYGYQTAPNPMAWMFGAAGAIAEMIGNPKTVGGRVTYGPVQVVDVRQQRVLWAEDVDASFERKVAWYNGQASYALLALKDANHRMIKKLNEHL